jgi:hypothetical protein
MALAFGVAFGIDAAGFDWAIIGRPVLDMLGLDINNDTVYVSMLFAIMGVIALCIFSVLITVRVSNGATDRIRTLFAATSICSLIFIVLAWFSNATGDTLGQISQTTLIAFVGMVILFQFRDMNNILGRLCLVVTALLIFATTMYALLAGGLWIVGSTMLATVLFDPESWSGEFAEPVYWATNAVAYGAALLAACAVAYILGVTRWGGSLFAVGEDRDIGSLYETFASPVIALTMVVMTIHTMLSPVYAEMFRGLWN